MNIESYNPSHDLRFQGVILIFEIFLFIWFFYCISGCAAPIVKLKCDEVQARLDHQDLSEDQKRFAEQELEECKKELDSAKRRDSSAVEKLESRKDSEDSL